jgi:hypothetical protein
LALGSRKMRTIRFAARPPARIDAATASGGGSGRLAGDEFG